MEHRRTPIGGYGEATEVDRYSWFSGAGDMGGGIEGGYGDDRFQTGDFPGSSIKGEDLTKIADPRTG